jgi:hypothetical protein
VLVPEVVGDGVEVLVVAVVVVLDGGGVEQASAVGS